MFYFIEDNASFYYVCEQILKKVIYCDKFRTVEIFSSTVTRIVRGCITDTLLTKTYDQ